MRRFFARLSNLLRPARAEREMSREIEAHVALIQDDLERRGMPPVEARSAALWAYGGVEQAKELHRRERSFPAFEQTVRDFRHALRGLRRSPGFTLTAVLTLALGLGANTAIFSVMYGILLRPLPYHDAARLIVLNETTPKVGRVSVSIPNFQDWRTESRTFPEMAVVNSVGFNLTGIEQPETISGEAVSPGFLRMLGVHPILGRDFDASEEKPGAAPVALLSYPLWQSHFGGDHNIVGRTMALDGRGFTIIGVLPASFRWTEKVDMLEPTGVWAAGNEAYNERGDRGDTVVVGRLAPRVSLAQARAEMEGITARLAKAYPVTNDGFGVALRPIRDAYVSEIRPAILVLFGAVTLVLLIACANVANLFLIRASGRSREMALRVAMGATRGHLLAQMLVESFILTALGGLTGLALAIAAVRGIGGLIPQGMLAGTSITLNGPTLMFAGAVVTLATFAFGVAPALAAGRSNIQLELQEGGRTANVSARTGRWRAALVVAEFSLSLILLVGGGLMMTSLSRLLSVDAGIRTERVLTMQMTLRTAQYSKAPAILNFWDQLLGRVRALPGVQSAALGTGVPLTDDHSRTDITIEGMELPKPGGFPHPDVHIVSPAYLSTLGVRLLRGREFTGMDTEKAPPIAMINAHLARQFFDARNPVGQRFMFGHPSAKRKPQWVTIVGVVGDTKLYGLANPSRLEVYVPLHQDAAESMTLLVKSAGAPAPLTSAIRAAIVSVDKDQPVFETATMEQIVRNSVSPQRITFILLGAFSALALVLAAIGIYGVVSYSVAQRRQEIGIRMALGAQPSEVLRMVIAQGARLAAIGLIIGIVAALALTRLLASLLYSVSPSDPATFATVTVVLALTAAAASYIPARRSVRVDPMRALRCE